MVKYSTCPLAKAWEAEHVKQTCRFLSGGLV